MRAVNVTALMFARQRLWERPSPSWRTATLITEHEAEAPFGYPEIHHLTSPLRRRRCARAIRKPSTCGRAVDFKGQVRSGRRDRQESDVTAHSRISAASQFRAAIMAATMRLLVVEDEQRLAAGLRKGLEAEGFAVDVVHNGTDGIWMARENPFDAIILDVMLPGANGYQVCRTLRNGIGVHSSDRCHCVTSWPKLGG